MPLAEVSVVHPRRSPSDMTLGLNHVRSMTAIRFEVGTSYIGHLRRELTDMVNRLLFRIEF